MDGLFSSATSDLLDEADPAYRNSSNVNRLLFCRTYGDPCLQDQNFIFQRALTATLTLGAESRSQVVAIAQRKTSFQFISLVLSRVHEVCEKSTRACQHLRLDDPITAKDVTGIMVRPHILTHKALLIYRDIANVLTPFPASATRACTQSSSSCCSAETQEISSRSRI